MRLFSVAFFCWCVSWGCVSVCRAQDLSKLSDADRKQVNVWMAERVEKMLVVHRLEEEIGQAWGNEKFTSPEVEKLRARYRELQAELLHTQIELQKKVLEVPAIQEKTRQLDAAKKQAEDLARKVKEKTDNQK